MRKTGQPWLFSPAYDLAFILGPAFFIALIVVVFYDHFAAIAGVPPLLWGVLIVGVDVSHVYSTLFRTYLDRHEFRTRRRLYILTPLCAWVVGTLLYSIDGIWFWRALAYLAVFHFIRQQYGFMMLYARWEQPLPAVYRRIDKAAIYLATLYPLVYWHTHSRDFQWFISGDFFQLKTPYLSTLTALVYGGVMAVYLAKEVLFWRQSHTFNLPRNLLLAGTALSWFVGIVAFNNDLAFTTTNVIAHGIPYIALIWIYGRNRKLVNATMGSPYVLPWIGALFRWERVPLFLAGLVMLAFFEEGLWDGLIWREHGALFIGFDALPAIHSTQTLTWLVPLLSLPQATHYLLDAFIWRLKRRDTEWKKVLFRTG